jgi:hypothetical protein
MFLTRFLCFCFTKFIQRTFEWESLDYTKYLNEKYKLCDACLLVFQHEIKQQDNQIKEMYSEEFKMRRPERVRKLKRKVYLADV